MATVSSLPLQRPKKLVRYGKSTSRSTYSMKSLSDLLEEDTVPSGLAAPEVNIRPTSTNAEPQPVEKPAMKPYNKPSEHRPPREEVTRKMVDPPTNKRDAFDVPSSDDDEHEVPLASALQPRVKAKRVLVSDVTVEEAQLTPWEKTKVAEKPIANTVAVATRRRSGRNTRDMREAQSIEPATALPVESPPHESELNSTSAAARLAARRPVANGAKPSNVQQSSRVTSTNKRAGVPGDIMTSASRKRSRKSPPSEDAGESATKTYSSSATASHTPSAKSHVTPAELDVFDVPDEVEETTAQGNRHSTLTVLAKSRRGRLSSLRTTPKKGLSAPARLVDMISTATGSTKTPSPALPEAIGVPLTLPNTVTPKDAKPSLSPSASVNSSPVSATHSAGMLTPKQKQLWSQLLPSDPVLLSPNALAGRERTAAGISFGDVTPSVMPTLVKSKSDIPETYRRRTRLVDRLKASAPASDAELSMEDSDEEVENDEQVDVEHAKNANVQSQFSASEQQSQSQDQQASAEVGPRITYARTRSYLPEDNLEDGLLFDLPSVTPQRPPILARVASKANTTCQMTAFDLDDSDEGVTTGKLRTVHELRAAGRNDRFMREAEALLDDIADHTHSGRSRRRSALVELSAKLIDKEYVNRFVAQGFEHKLVAECSAAPDTIANFVLASAFALVLASEPPEHTVTALKQTGVLNWLAQQLECDVGISKLVADRQYNMSRTAQGTLVEFADSMQSQQLLWDDAKPLAMSPRLIALKALEQLVTALRRAGDRTELLDDQQLELVIPEEFPTENTETLDIILAISLLESLSTSALALAWPQAVLERLALQFPHLGPTLDVPPHALFLLFRLTLNLTNDNAPNCEIFATDAAIHHLLQTIQSLFAKLEPTDSQSADDQQRPLDLDLLVLAMGITINLAEHNARARAAALRPVTRPTYIALLTTFTAAQARMVEAASVEESSTNVAFGYLAVMLANLCQDPVVKVFTKLRLGSEGLGVLVGAVEEFVRHHQIVDRLALEGEEGREVWSGFTERLRGMLARLKAVVFD